MKKFIMALFVIAAAMMAVSPVFATELWDEHLRGLDEGLAAGALPPPGLYFVNDEHIAVSDHFAGTLAGGNGINGAFLAPSGHLDTNFKLFAYVEVPVLLWVPGGCKFLCADYAMAIAQPFDYMNLRLQSATPNPPHTFIGNANWGTFNTVLVPYILSWKLPCDLHLGTGLGISLQDAMSSPGVNSVGQNTPFAGNGNGFYTFQPSLGLSWLHAGWNLGASFHYAFNLENPMTQYTSGDQIAVDYTATYTCGKWTFGFGAFEETQVTSDSGPSPTGNVNRIVNLPDSKANVWGGGPIVGYNFGPCSVQFIYNFPFYANNDVAGQWFDVRFVVPLWK